MLARILSQRIVVWSSMGSSVPLPLSNIMLRIGSFSVGVKGIATRSIDWGLLALLLGARTLLGAPGIATNGAFLLLATRSYYVLPPRQDGSLTLGHSAQVHFTESLAQHTIARLVSPRTLKRPCCAA